MTTSAAAINPAETTAAPKPPATASVDGIEIRLIRSSELPLYRDAWEQLAYAALVPNPFYEPWMLLPAINQADGDNLHFLLVFGAAAANGSRPLWGFFPLQVQSRCLHLRIRNVSFWQYRNCHLTTPLLNSTKAWEVLEAFWRWFENNPWKCSILDTELLLADGPFYEVWADHAIGRSSLILRDFPRAFLVSSGNPSAYMSAMIAKKRLDEYYRLERRLGEQGCLEYHQVENASDVEGWIDDFLRLEAAGWKGGDGGKAFAKFEEDVSYLRTISHEGFGQNRLMLLSLTLDGRVIAMKFNILSGDGGFALRIAYDEEFAKYSPGVLLELENIRRVFNSSRTKWMDSCAHPRHVMADRIWRERRMIRRTLFSNGSRRGDFWMGTLPLLRWVRRQVRPAPEEHYLGISTRKPPQTKK